jgi:glycosyltransferase involved in cell wall biosynthesis
LRIVFHHRIRSKDGQAVHMEEMIGALRGLGHEVLLVGPGAFARATFGHDPKQLSSFKKRAPKILYEVLELGYNLLAFSRLYRACMKFRPDFIYERCNLNLLAGIWYRRLMRVPLVLEVNAPLSQERARFGGLGCFRLAAFLERWVWRNADYVLPVTRRLAEEIHTGGVPMDRIMVVPNAIDPLRFPVETDGGEVKRELGLEGKIVLGFVGFVREWHGLDSVVNLLARPDAPSTLHLLIIGAGLEKELMEQASGLGVSHRLTFAGLVDREHIGRYISAFDVALLPACVDYCSPLKLFEYMAAGKAIVAPDQENIREIVTSEESCLLFDPGSRESMAGAVHRLATDVELRERLGHTARALISSRGYTWRQNAGRVTAVAMQALSRRVARPLPVPQ